MSGGTVKILWSREDSAEVTIYHAAGQAATAFKVNGSPVTFPYTLSADTTFITTVGDSYSVSVLYNDIEIADHPDGRKAVSLFNGNSELTFAPSPDDGFVFPGVQAAGGGPLTGPAVFSLGIADPQIPNVGGIAVTFGALNQDGERDPLHPEWFSIVDGQLVCQMRGVYELNAISGGLYLTTTDAEPYDGTDAVWLQGGMFWSVNDNNQAPAWYSVARSGELLLSAATDLTVGLNSGGMSLSIPQPLEVGDVVGLEMRLDSVPVVPPGGDFGNLGWASNDSYAFITRRGDWAE